MSRGTVAIATLGCKVNQCDSGTLADDLAAAGVLVVGLADRPDVVVVNTCGVTRRANAQSRQLIRRLKEANPDGCVVVTGCYAATEANELAALPEVERVVAVGHDRELIQAVRRLAGSRSGGAASAGPFSSRPKMAVEGHSRAFLKIQEGCDLGCAFCIVPRARGGSTSVSTPEVLGAIDRLVAGGFEEVVLCGPNLGGWGRDLRPARELADLVEAIATHSTLARLRLSSVNPNELGPRLITAIAESRCVCPHMHIPIQTGDDRILALMRRRYDRHRIALLMNTLVDRLPDVSIGTDVIVGFPGEDDGSFANTRRFLAALPLAYLHVFPFSPRPRTPAARLAGRATGQRLRARVSELAQMGRELRRRFWERFVGRTVEVLVETRRDRETGLLRGFTPHYVRVLLPGDDGLMNKRVRVRLRGIAAGGVIGFPLGLQDERLGRTAV